MNDLEILRFLFTVATVLWAVAAFMFTMPFCRVIFRNPFLPFLYIAVLFGITNLVESGFYAYVLWLEPGHRELSRFALFTIPGSLIFKAAGFFALSWWVVTRREQREREVARVDAISGDDRGLR